MSGIGLFGTQVLDGIKESLSGLGTLDRESLIAVINEVKRELHKHSPFAGEPVDCVVWIPAEDVVANDYNPNKVAPPEMKLLEHSIAHDGYTQPIVAWPRDGAYEVIDGFHRHRVGSESKVVSERVHGHLPLSVLHESNTSRNDRIASTIRHNRARGKHQVTAMSDIVVELKRRNWSDDRISRELGMDSDEVLRLCQVSGLAEIFADSEFSSSWDLEAVNEDDFEFNIEAGQ